MFCPDPNTSATILDSFHGVLDLEVPTIRREDGVGKIVAGAYRSLEKRS